MIGLILSRIEAVTINPGSWVYEVQIYLRAAIALFGLSTELFVVEHINVVLKSIPRSIYTVVYARSPRKKDAADRQAAET